MSVGSHDPSSPRSDRSERRVGGVMRDEERRVAVASLASLFERGVAKFVSSESSRKGKRSVVPQASVSERPRRGVGSRTSR